MQFLQKPVYILQQRNTYFFFSALVVLVSLLLWAMNRNVESGDHYTYLFYLKGFEAGRYSYWYFLEDYIPDTFRNPGYPLFLYLLSFISPSVHFIQFVQWVLLMGAVIIMLKIIELYQQGYLIKNLFLIFVLLNFVTLSYSAYVFPENLVLFVITLIVFVEIKWESGWKKTILLVFLYGFCFQVRPVILFIPFIRFAYYLYFRSKEKPLFNIAFIVLFAATLLPYAFWNKKHHDQFKITPLEGGGGVMYLGYWSPKMLNVVEDRYWRNVMYEDALFNFVDMKDVPHHVKLFNNEWDSIERICSKYMTAKDTAILLEMKKHPHLFVTYNTTYTLEREKLLKELAVRHYLSDLKYTVSLKTYTFFRLWYTGLTAKQFMSERMSVFIPQLLAFLTTFTTLLLFIGYFLYALFRRRDLLLNMMIPLFWCAYFAAIHVPFAIQSRYTIPVRFLYLFVLVYLMYHVHSKKEQQPTAIQH